MLCCAVLFARPYIAAHVAGCVMLRGGIVVPGAPCLATIAAQVLGCSFVTGKKYVVHQSSDLSLSGSSSLSSLISRRSRPKVSRGSEVSARRT